LGTELLKRLVEVGRAEKLSRLSGHILADNHTMSRISGEAGFKVGRDAGGRDFVAEYMY
jgi:acetyltransferase